MFNLYRTASDALGHKNTAKHPGVGWTLPNSNYIGPGNPYDNGEAVDEADRVAEEHDRAYEIATSAKEIADADKKAIEKFNKANSLNGFIGEIGLRSKSWLENIVGPIYPSASELERRSIAGEMSLVFKDKYKEYNGYPEEWKRQTYKTHPHYFKEQEIAPKGGFDGPAAKRLKFDYDSKRNHGEGTSKDTGESAAKKPRIDVQPADSSQIGSDSSTPELSFPSTAHSSINPPYSEAQQTVSSSSDIVDSVPMDLPGTGKPQGDNGSPGGDEYYLPIKRTNFGTRETSYSKTFQVVSECFASVVVAQNDTTPYPGRFLTSELLEIPWHLPAMYMSPSEYECLQPGSHVQSVRCKITFRGTTVKFDTNSTSTQIATLNTIQTLRAGVGLNKTGWGVQAFYTAQSNMTPTQVAAPAYVANGSRIYDLTTELYGNGERTVPGAYQTGNFWIGRNYWVEKGPFTVANPGIGWPMARTQKCKTWDAKTMVDKVIVDETYVPKMAPITPPLRYYREATPTLPQGFNVQTGGNLSAFRTASLNQASGNTTVAENEENGSNIPPAAFDLHTPIEKSQVCRSGPWGQIKPQIQPSINVGVQAMPQLGSIQYLIGTVEDYVKASAYYDVELTMKVVERAPTHYSHFDFPNCPAGDEIFNITPNPAIDPTQPTYAGLYVN